MGTEENKRGRNRKVRVLIRVKPKYTKEFCILLVACKRLCDKVCGSRTLAEIEDVFSVSGPFDFLLKLKGGDGEKVNKTIFKIRETLGSYINETLTLTELETLSSEEGYRNVRTALEGNCLGDAFDAFEELSNREELKTSTFEDLKRFKRELRNEAGATNDNTEEAKVFVLIKIKTKYIEEVYIMMKMFKALLDAGYKKYAKINDLFPVFGPYDFFCEINASGESEEVRNDKINRTILKIRELFFREIAETVTLTKFDMKMTKEELKRFFKTYLGVETIHKQDGGEIPDKFSMAEINLKEEIPEAKITSLESLLKSVKTFLEPEGLNRRIDELAKRIEEREKRR